MELWTNNLDGIGKTEVGLLGKVVSGFGYNFYAHNHYGAGVYSCGEEIAFLESLERNMWINGKGEDWVYYCNHKSNVRCSNVEDSVAPMSEPSLPQFEAQHFVMEKKKAKLQFSSDETYELGWHKTNEDSFANCSSVSEFGDDNFAIDSREQKKLVSSEGHMKLQAQVFFVLVINGASNQLVEMHKNLGKNETRREQFPDRNFSIKEQLELKAILYLPKSAQFDLFDTRKKLNFMLYVKRVFTMDHCKELIFGCLGFVKGVVDSNDLPPNFFREMLQPNKILMVIRKNFVNKCTEVFNEIVENNERYELGEIQKL
ncbi:heat shock protein 82-like [Durio zibethinus]|uniref:Heat shock protein 82-like n=1 Tax=Durio zibethinus TaxID=66656 RepID=A0A6P5Z7T7_DURZI|nr:heat shock protein 82-like [Durio zibethinus]